MTKRPPKTIKEKKFVKEYLKTGNGTEAALSAYDTKDRKSASVIATENLAKLSIADIMDQMGITDERLMQVLDDGLNASRTISTIGGREANGATVDFVDVPDFISRHKYLETGLKLKDKFPSSKIDHTSGGKPIPLLGGVTNVSTNNSDTETTEA